MGSLGKLLALVLGSAIVATLTLGADEATAGLVGPLLMLVFLVLLFSRLLIGARSGHGSARSLRGLVRYQPENLGESALLGVAIGEIGLAAAMTTGATTVAAAVVAFLCRRSDGVFGSSRELVRARVSSVIGVLALAATVRSIATTTCLRPQERLAVLAVAAVAAVAAAGGVFGTNRIIRAGTRLGRARFSDMVLGAFAVVDLVAFVTANGVGSRFIPPPALFAVGIGLIAVLWLAGAAPALVLGLLGIGLAAVKAYAALVELALVPTAQELCLGGLALIAPMIAFLLFSGARLGRRAIP